MAVRTYEVPPKAAVLTPLKRSDAVRASPDSHEKNKFPHYFEAVNRILSINRVESKKTATVTRAPFFVDSTGRSVSESTIAT